MLRERRSGPTSPDRAAPEVSVTTNITTVSVSLEADVVAAYCNAYAVLVETSEGGYRRRLMLSLHSAQKAVQRAEAAGHEARMVLVKITPITGGDFHV